MSTLVYIQLQWLKCTNIISFVSIMLVWHTICLCLWHQGETPFFLVQICFRRSEITSKIAREGRTEASRAGGTLYSFCAFLMGVEILRLVWRTSPFQRQHGGSGTHWDRVCLQVCVIIHSCSHQNSLLKSYEVCVVYYLHWAYVLRLLLFPQETIK